MGGDKKKRKMKARWEEEEGQQTNKKRKHSSSSDSSISSSPNQRSFLKADEGDVSRRSSFASAGGETREEYKRRKEAKKKKKEKTRKHKKEKKKKSKKGSRDEKCEMIKKTNKFGPEQVEKICIQETSTEMCNKDNPVIPVQAVPKRSLAPMTKEEYEKQQSVIRRVIDPETGRGRLVKGDGEILEECVSKARHRDINKKATKSDGASFQRMLGLN